MHHILDLVEFALTVVAAVALSALVVAGVVTGRLHLGRRRSVGFREHPGAFLGWFLLFAWVAFLSVQEAIGFLGHSVTP